MVYFDIKGFVTLQLLLFVLSVISIYLFSKFYGYYMYITITSWLFNVKENNQIK